MERKRENTGTEGKVNGKWFKGKYISKKFHVNQNNLNVEEV